MPHDSDPPRPPLPPPTDKANEDWEPWPADPAPAGLWPAPRLRHQAQVLAEFRSYIRSVIAIMAADQSPDVRAHAVRMERCLDCRYSGLRCGDCPLE